MTSVSTDDKKFVVICVKDDSVIFKVSSFLRECSLIMRTERGRNLGRARKNATRFEGGRKNFQRVLGGGDNFFFHFSIRS